MTWLTLDLTLNLNFCVTHMVQNLFSSRLAHPPGSLGSLLSSRRSRTKPSTSVARDTSRGRPGGPKTTQCNPPFRNSGANVGDVLPVPVFSCAVALVWVVWACRYTGRYFVQGKIKFSESESECPSTKACGFPATFLVF